MKSPKDYIDEMNREQAERDFLVLGIAVKVGDQAAGFVFSRGIDPLEKLSAMMSKGGQPIGLIGVNRSAPPIPGLIYTRLFAEYRSESWAEEYLNATTQAFGTLFERVADVSVVPIPPPDRN